MRIDLRPAVIVVTLVAGACSSGGSADKEEARGSVTFSGLCEAQAAASDGLGERASQLFDHIPLHDLAQRLTEADRAMAARLLEAKQRVELATLSPIGRPETMAEDLAELAELTRDAQRIVGDPILEPCP